MGVVVSLDATHACFGIRYHNVNAMVGILWAGIIDLSRAGSKSTNLSHIGGSFVAKKLPISVTP